MINFLIKIIISKIILRIKLLNYGIIEDLIDEEIGELNGKI